MTIQNTVISADCNVPYCSQLRTSKQLTSTAWTRKKGRHVLTPKAASPTFKKNSIDPSFRRRITHELF